MRRNIKVSAIVLGIFVVSNMGCSKTDKFHNIANSQPSESPTASPTVVSEVESPTSIINRAILNHVPESEWNRLSEIYMKCRKERNPHIAENRVPPPTHYGQDEKYFYVCSLKPFRPQGGGHTIAVRVDKITGEYMLYCFELGR